MLCSQVAADPELYDMLAKACRLVQVVGGCRWVTCFDLFCRSNSHVLLGFKFLKNYHILMIMFLVFLSRCLLCLNSYKLCIAFAFSPQGCITNMLESRRQRASFTVAGHHAD